LLAGHFLKKFAEKNHKQVKMFTPVALQHLRAYTWPGNVRELENAVERAVVLLAGEYVTERDLPPAILSGQAESAAPGGVSSGVNLEDVERKTIMAALEAVRGNKSEAARRLGITRKTLYAKLQRYEGQIDKSAQTG
jgi:two-component system response regulator HydG